MDQKLNNRMINGNLLCKDITETKVSTLSGFSVDVETKFRDLEVLESSEDEIPVGSVIVVPYHSGKEYNGNMIVNRGNIIHIK